ncbi:hypothetical protein [Streptomyces scopuliridis]|uniref:Uncharacterized protein n=1 Tax=Streptomyces scopuliridis RB72 TaxID=1440053 RepID=A0A2T7SWB0_9ACTN|nr:hypothetical protein [Streptomyces scopuliridis]PVE07196.1 hypothetical protein Y717_24165 [Streptomyces scopuliridis RB72]
MGIESDQLVYDYLSRVGDEAQQRHLPSGDRMRLVSSLRNEIDKQRGKAGGDSPAAVRRILGRLGTPDAVVQAASEGASGDDAPTRAPEPPQPVLPEQRTRRVKGARRLVIPEQASESPAPAMPAASPPHLAGMDELGPPGGSQPDWWRIEPGPMGSAEHVPGFVGGVEIPDILKPPPKPKEKPDKTAEGAEAEDGDATEDRAEEAAHGAGRRRWRPRLSRRDRGRSAEKEKRAGGLSNPFLLLAAALLVAGAVFGSWPALGGGWLLAYASRTLSRAEAKWAVFGLPGVSAAGGLVWLWGRLDGRWGEAIPQDGMAEALSSAWPVVLRTAAVTSALYLVWRARRKQAR